MSEEACTKSELEVFRPVDVLVSYTDGRWQSYQPLNSLNNAEVIEFVIPGTSNEVIDMNNISLYIRAKIVTSASAALDDAETLHPVDNTLQSIIRHTELSINGQLVTRTSRDGPYKDYMKRVLFHDMPAGSQSLFQNRLAGFYMDEAGLHDAAAATALAAGKAAKVRQGWISESKWFEFRGTPQVDLFESDRVLIPGADMQLKFYIHDPSFFLQRPKTAADKFKLVFEAAELNVRRIGLADTFVNEINQKIKKQNAIYPFLRTESMSLTLPSGIMQYTKENLSRGPMPVRVIIGLVDSTAYVGDYSKSPFNFQHCSVNEIALFENGFPVAQAPLKIQWKAAHHQSINAYNLLLESIGAIGERSLTPAVDYERFKNGCSLYVFTRAPDLCHGEYHLPNQTGNLTLRINFATALAKSFTAVVLLQFNSRIEINEYKNLITDFAI